MFDNFRSLVARVAKIMDSWLKDTYIISNNSHGGIIRVCMGIFTTTLPRTTDAKPQFASKNSGLEVSNSPRPHQP